RSVPAAATDLGPLRRTSPVELTLAVGALVAAALLGALAVPARAADVNVNVRNDAAPKVWFASPSDGDRLTAGDDVAVRVRSEGGEALEVTVNGLAAWTVRSDAIDGRWTPQEGRYRMVAVVSAPGRPDGVAAIEVTGVAPDPAPAAADQGASAPASPATPAYLPGAASGPGTIGPGAVRRRVVPAAPARGRPAAGPTAAFPVAPSTGEGASPSPAPPARAADRDRAGGGGGGLGARIAAILRDPEKVAWGAALPLMLMVLGGGYLLLQRFIDGGQKLAWRGRGRPDDTIIDF
ncbi:MAG TPA: hypothetical protein VFG74_08845, partial [Miltoncostaeaceae bacterium]|nr:hypothetical protein [Miltoncostaeaceae bacterium]